MSLFSNQKARDDAATKEHVIHSTCPNFGDFQTSGLTEPELLHSSWDRPHQCCIRPALSQTRPGLSKGHQSEQRSEDISEECSETSIENRQTVEYGEITGLSSDEKCRRWHALLSNTELATQIKPRLSRRLRFSSGVTQSSDLAHRVVFCMHGLRWYNGETAFLSLFEHGSFKHTTTNVPRANNESLTQTLHRCFPDGTVSQTRSANSSLCDDLFFRGDVEKSINLTLERQWSSQTGGYDCTCIKLLLQQINRQSRT